VTAREVKRECCLIVASLIDNYLDVGAALTNTKSEREEEQHTRAMEQLRDELLRRGRQ
jgi:hypothetical protein